MEALQDFSSLFQALIAFCAVFTALGFLFNVLLNPLKENQAKMEKDIHTVKKDIDTVKKELAAVQADISIIKKAVLKP